MKPKVLNCIVLILSCSLILSCNTNNDDQAGDCISYGIGYVTAVDAPTNANVNEIINIKIKFQVFNGCGQFGKYVETQNGAVRTIEVEAKYEGCICTQDIPVRTINYVFKADRPGEYTLNFKSSETEFITANLIIN